MKSRYQKEFEQFLNKVSRLKDAENATFAPSDEILNAVILSGEIVGSDTSEKIKKIGLKYGLLVMAYELTVLDRQGKP